MLETIDNMEEVISMMPSKIEHIIRIEEDDELAYEKTFLAYRSIGVLPIITRIIKKETPIFRSRTHSDTGNFYRNIEEISYPQKQYVKNFARLNRPYQSVFYGSDNRPTSYMELTEYWAEEKEIGEEVSVTIGRWELQRDLILAMIPIPNHSERVSNGEKEVGSFYDEKKKEFSEIKVRISDMLFDFLSKEFKKPAKKKKKTYLNTCSYGNIILTDEKIDGILYPSVPFGGQGYNIAIRKTIVDNGNIKLVKAWKDTLIITQNELGNHRFVQIKNMEAKEIDSKKGKIEWN